jgi:hypothetical protein
MVPTAHASPTTGYAPPATFGEIKSDGSPATKPQSYHRLAEIMSKDRSFAIFRRFDELNMLQLMALQAEIIELRGLFHAQSRHNDRRCSESGQYKMYSRYFRALRESEVGDKRSSSATPSSRHPSSTLELMTVMQQRMAEYSMLILEWPFYGPK